LSPLDEWIAACADGPVRARLSLGGSGGGWPGDSGGGRPGGPGGGRPGDSGGGRRGAPELSPVEGLLAGAAEVDITPPPGLPKAGHSRNAKDGTGFRTRLRARVLHLRTSTVSLALIAGDMHAGSALVRRLVLEAVTGDTDVLPSGLFLGTTHTHAGPGQFHGCDFYNRWASNRPGLDPVYTDYLVTRLAGAVRHAVTSRRPARLATGSADVWGLTRNRSLAAHVLNSSVADKRLEPQRKYAAVNPWLHLIRVDGAEPDGGTAPMAAFAFFSIHGTGISRLDPAYNADVWAYINGAMAAGIEATTGRRVVTGAVEGTHGDMTPAVRDGLLVYPEAERVGRGIGAAAAELHARLERRLSNDVRLAAAFREIDLDTRPVIGGVRLPDPAVGAAKLAGAVENTTPVLDRIPPFRAGHPKPHVLAGEHGAKWVFGGRFVQHRVAPVSSFPRVLPLQFLVVGGFAILGLPFEVTVEAGRRLESSGAALGAERVVVSSTANDYWDYLTTREEYSRQCYEGASTLYGPSSLDFVSAATDALARDLAASSAGVVDDSRPVRTFDAVLQRYMPAPSTALPGARPAGRLIGPARFVEATATEDPYWEVAWTAGAPGSLRWDQPLVRVEGAVGRTAGVSAGWVAGRSAGPVAGAGAAADRAGSLGLDWAAVADDSGWYVGVEHTGHESNGGHTYVARWYQPPLGRPGRYRFVLEANGGYGEVAGEAFD
jgi:neutral ceramidase